MIAVLFASHFNARVELVTELLGRQNIPYKLYGGTNTWRGFGDKLRAAHQASKELTDYEHILFLDAHDVLVLDGPTVILERFKRFRHPWVCNAEPNIWPPNSFRPEDYPPSDSPWRYLNSGAYMAERAYMRELFDRWVGDGEISVGEDDQHWLATRYIKEPGCIKLDTNCEMFQCLIGGWGHFETGYYKFKNTHTGTEPIVLHHNGGGSLQEERIKRVWDEA